ncbi:hypothetical protein BD410DRAFT_825544 [Rickenella mellea]|uniref:Uncharacterized protein n=1 Tax=Rickenella mellea TaxID=50990 RepID=A0A4Y7QIS5_9AGAM|nr:hypothetical protein BD410DRAFT_825544 [Rickenella mellea]
MAKTRIRSINTEAHEALDVVDGKDAVQKIIGRREDIPQELIEILGQQPCGYAKMFQQAPVQTHSTGVIVYDRLELPVQVIAEKLASPKTPTILTTSEDRVRSHGEPKRITEVANMWQTIERHNVNASIAIPETDSLWPITSITARSLSHLRTERHNWDGLGPRMTKSKQQQY